MRAIVIVLDSFGIGAAPDAARYGDCGSNTYHSICKGIRVPNMIRMGLHLIDGVDLPSPRMMPFASYARLVPQGAGKDTTTGHWELCGLCVDRPLPTYPNGFPSEIVEKLQKAWGIKILGNCAASGTEIIQRLGDLHRETKCPIVYTSADSVLQIACDEQIYPVETLYRMCIQAREIMAGEHAVGRIIARPFEKRDGKYVRTENRKDFALQPLGGTMLDRLYQKHIPVIGVGKISDIFGGRGITYSYAAHGNDQVGKAVLDAMGTYAEGLIFANFVDFDMLYGHRRDIEGYRACLERFDAFLPQILNRMQQEDMLIITADHGCDPAFRGTDHTRECVPMLINRVGTMGRSLGTIHGFGAVAKCVERHLADVYAQDALNGVDRYADGGLLDDMVMDKTDVR